LMFAQTLQYWISSPWRIPVKYKRIIATLK